MILLLAASSLWQAICTVLAVIFMLTMPAVILWLVKKVKFLGFIGAIALCYALGIIVSVIPIPYDRGLTETLSSVFVAIAIPLILFTFDIGSVRYLAKNTVISFVLVIVSAMAVSVASYFAASAAGLANANVLSGMTTGLYTGGTPNMIAIAKALLGNASSDVIAAAQISDFFVGGIYFLLILTVIKPIYKRFLGDKRDKGDGKSALEQQDGAYTQSGNVAEEYKFASIPRDRKSIVRLTLVIVLAVLCLGLGVCLEILINGNMQGSLYIILTVSILGIALSLFKPVRNVKGSYQIGQYLVLIFSLGLSMSIDITQLVRAILPTLAFFACSQMAVILLHLLLCKIFRIDAGTALITSVAGIYGPPFIAPVANAFGDRDLIVPGVICGTFGLAIGTLLGWGLGALLGMIVI